MIWVLALGAVIMLNIPFGYWRENVRKFSRQWFLSVHLPIPLIICLRIHLGLGWKWTTYPVLVGAYFLGQFIGAMWHRVWVKRMRVSNWLFYDIVRKL